MKKFLLFFPFLLNCFTAMADDVTGIVKKASMPNCPDGGIDLSVSGGFEPYVYFWMGPNNFTATTEDLTNILPGSYTVVVNDALCGEASVTFEVGYDDVSIFISDKQNLYECGGAGTTEDGALTLSVPGPGYTFNWSGPGNFSSTSQNLTGLTQPGTYIVTVTNAVGCTKVLKDELCCCFVDDKNGHVPSSYYCSNSPGSAFNLQIGQSSLSAPLTHNSLDGSIDISVNSSGLNLYYHWTGPNGFTANTQDVTGLNPGEYCVTVTNGCSYDNACYELVVCADGKMELSGSSASTCPGFSAGSITTTVTGYYPPFTYKWSNGSTTSSLQNLTAGQYCVTVTDATGCKKSGCYTVGSTNSVTTATTVPCSVTTTCNGQSHIQNYNYQVSWDCNTRYSYCPATGQTVVENFGYASVNLVGCTLVGLCMDGTTRIIESGNFVTGTFVVESINCPLKIGCAYSACYLPSLGYILPSGTPVQCSYVTYQQGNCPEGQCYARAFCGESVVAEGCVEYPICSGEQNVPPENFNLFKALGIKKEVFTEQEALALVSEKQKELTKHTATEDNSIKLHEAHNSNNIVSSIYPNPFSDEFTISMKSDDKSDIKIEVVNLLGMIVYMEKNSIDIGNNEKILNIANSPSGIYFVNIYNSQGLIALHKIIKE